MRIDDCQLFRRETHWICSCLFSSLFCRFSLDWSVEDPSAPALFHPDYILTTYTETHIGLRGISCNVMHQANKALVQSLPFHSLYTVLRAELDFKTYKPRTKKWQRFFSINIIFILQTSVKTVVLHTVLERQHILKARGRNYNSSSPCYKKQQTSPLLSVFLPQAGLRGINTAEHLSSSLSRSTVSLGLQSAAKHQLLL